MKRLAAVIIVSVGLFIAAPVVAAQFVSEDSVAKVESGQTVNDDLFLAGETVIIDGTVNGDVYAAAAETVLINGTVNGDVYAVAGKIEVKGTIRDDLIAAGQSITVLGAIGDGLTAAGEVITAEKSANIGGGVLAAGSDLALRAGVGRGVTAAGDTISIDGPVGRQVLLTATKITLNSGAKIDGDLRYQSEEDLIKNQGSQINGQTVRLDKEAKNDNDPYAINWGFVLWGFLSSAVVGLILMKLMPTATPAVASSIVNHPLPVLGWGLVVLFLTPPLLIMLLISIIGIPLAILAAILFLVLLYLSQMFVALAVGKIMADRTGRPVNSYIFFVIGLAILTLVGLVPVLNGIAGFVIVLLGLGGITYYAKSRIAAPAAPKPLAPEKNDK